MSKLSLREVIKEEYGVDLPISGGVGLSQDDPVVINTSNQLDASNIQWRVIQSANQSLKRAWLISNKLIFKDGDKLIEKVTTNVNYYQDKKPMRVVWDFYFDISGVIFDRVPTYTYFPTVYVDRGSEIAVPFQISWVNFKNFIDNEKDNPGLGLTISYSCPTVKATFYIYNNQIPRIDPKEDYDLIAEEFDNSVSQIDGVEIKSKLLNSIESEGFFKKAFKVGGEDSYILFTAINNYFCKFRVTQTNEPLADEMVIHVLEQFIVFLRLYKTKNTMN